MKEEKRSIYGESRRNMYQKELKRLDESIISERNKELINTKLSILKKKFNIKFKLIKILKNKIIIQHNSFFSSRLIPEPSGLSLKYL